MVKEIPAESTATSSTTLNVAAVASPPSPLKLKTPVPAKAVMIPAVTLRTRLLESAI